MMRLAAGKVALVALKAGHEWSEDITEALRLKMFGKRSCAAAIVHRMSFEIASWGVCGAVVSMTRTEAASPSAASLLERPSLPRSTSAQQQQAGTHR